MSAHVLVIANRTAGSDELLDALRERAERSPARFHLVVPATPHGVTWATDMHAAHEPAEHDLEGALGRIRALGIEIDGEVGDPDPLAAVTDAAGTGRYDELIVSTLPHHLSRWLKLDLPRRAAHATGLPTTQVTASRQRAPA